jgi:hypothetical protein
MDTTDSKPTAEQLEKINVSDTMRNSQPAITVDAQQQARIRRKVQCTDICSFAITPINKKLCVQYSLTDMSCQSFVYSIFFHTSTAEMLEMPKQPA